MQVIEKHFNAEYAGVIKKFAEKVKDIAFPLLPHDTARDGFALHLENLIKEMVDGKEIAMNNAKKYLVIYNYGSNGDSTELFEATSVKDCIIKFADYVGDNCELFRKALTGCSESDNDCVEMYKMFGAYLIKAIYTIGEVVYEEH